MKVVAVIGMSGPEHGAKDLLLSQPPGELREELAMPFERGITRALPVASNANFESKW